MADPEVELRAALAAQDWVEVARVTPLLDALDASPQGAVSIVSAALWYAERGLKVFPLRPMSKLPRPGSRGCKDATSDPDLIRQWWREEPNANLGIATGHVVDVMDFDGVQGHASWGEAFPDPALPWGHGVEVLATVSTPRPGGLHVYLPATGGGNRAGFLPCVDYRGLGGYVVAPPSITDQGSYRFLRTLNLEDS